ncbi:hypothetical protein N183_17545 [Sinorhizobium sp. Sb3]|nr:hypothetical protein N183_17545 [Sinorhizobium sp. Sb3]
MKTFSVVANVQIDRTAAFPAKFADNPFRAVALDTVQRRNAILDALFYDVGVLDEEETPELAFCWLEKARSFWCRRPEAVASKYFSRLTNSLLRPLRRLRSPLPAWEAPLSVPRLSLATLLMP